MSNVAMWREKADALREHAKRTGDAEEARVVLTLAEDVMKRRTPKKGATAG